MSSWEVVQAGSFNIGSVDLGNDILLGNADNDILAGGADGDTLTGGTGNDSYGYQFLTDSLLSDFDVITNFNAVDDVFLLESSLAVGAFNPVGSPATLDETGIQAVLPSVTFTANSAAQFSFGGFEYVAINDATAGFLEADDAIIQVNAISNGSLALGNFASAVI